MGNYTALITYSLDDGHGEQQKTYMVVALDRDNAWIRAVAQWNTEVMSNTEQKAVSLRCEVEGNN